MILTELTPTKTTGKNEFDSESTNQDSINKLDITFRNRHVEP